MRIPTHQIHNVLNAYARRLAREEGGNAEERDRARALFSDKRRFIINQIIEDTLQNVIKARNAHPDGANASGTEKNTHPDAEKSHLLYYQRMTSDHQKIRSVLEITELDFLPGDEAQPPPVDDSEPEE